MKVLIFIITVILSTGFIVSAQDLQTARRNLMPVPADVAWKSGRLPVTKNFTAALTGKTDERLKDYLSRVLRRLEGRTVLEFARDLSNDPANAAAFDRNRVDRKRDSASRRRRIL